MARAARSRSTSTLSPRSSIGSASVGRSSARSSAEGRASSEPHDAMRANASGTTAVVRGPVSVALRTVTTGVAKRPRGSMSSMASTRVSELPASTVSTTGAPASTAARVVRLRSDTAQASTAKTSSAQATVTIAISRRSAGRRAIWTPARAGATRPRRSARRDSGPAVGMAAWDSSRPPAMASSPGASRATGPLSPDSSVTTPAAAAATTAPSTRPTCSVEARGGTRRSRAVSGCRRVGAPATTRARRPAAAAATTARPNGQRASRRTPSSSHRAVAPRAASQPTAAPTAAPPTTRRPSSRISRPAAPPVPRPRRRARAISGRRCSVAAAHTKVSTTMPSTASCTERRGMTVLAWSRCDVVDCSSGASSLVADPPSVRAAASTRSVARRRSPSPSRSTFATSTGTSRCVRSADHFTDATVDQGVRTSSTAGTSEPACVGFAACGVAWPRPDQKASPGAGCS